MNEKFLEVILQRSSCRSFLPEPLEEQTIERLLGVMQRAPSAGNLQPWHFYVVTDDRSKEGLVQAAYGQSFLGEAPVVFVVCTVAERTAPRYGDRGRNLYCIQDTAAAIENLLLAAEALDLGGCWIGAFNEAAASNVLNIQRDMRPVAIIPVGHPARKPERTPRLPLSEVTTYVR